MSLWSVEQNASVNLVDSLFKHINEGKNRLEALRLARKEIRNQGYDHPFFWAPFILVGEVRWKDLMEASSEANQHDNGSN